MKKWLWTMAFAQLLLVAALATGVRQALEQDVVLKDIFRRNEQNMAWLGRLTPPFKASRPITPLRQTEQDVRVHVESAQ